MKIYFITQLFKAASWTLPVFIILLTLAFQVPSVKAAQSFVACGAAVTATGGNLTSVGIPAGILNNDILVIYVHQNDNVDSTMAGWTNNVQGNGDSSNRLEIFWKRTTGSESAPTVTHTSGSGSIARMCAFRGAVTSGDPFDVVGSVQSNTGGGRSPISTTAITTLSQGAMIIHIFGSADDNTWGSYTGTPTTEAAQNAFDPSGNSNDNSSGLTYGLQSSAGSTGAAGATQATLGPDTGVSVQMALKPVSITTLANGNDPSNASLAPGASATDLDSFTLQTNAGSDTVAAATVALASGSAGGLSLVAITSDNGATTYCSQANPVSDTVSLTSCGIPVTTSLTQLKIRITPKSHADMPAPPGSTYSVTGAITAFISTNPQSGSDTGSATVTIDNASPANVTSASATSGNAQVSLSWTNPADSDFHSTIVLRRTTSIVTDTPSEGSTYIAGNTIGSSVVACIVASPTASCTDTGLTNGTAYYYKIFSRDTNANYATGTIPTGSPVTPSAPPTASLSLSHPGAITAGNRGEYNLIRKDEFDNLVTAGNETFYLYTNASSGNHLFYDAATNGNIITSITITNGTSSSQFWYYDETVASPTITASDNSSSPDGSTGIVDATDQITITAAATAQLLLNAPSDITAGTRASYAVTRKDEFGNLTTSGTSTVYLYSGAAGLNDKFYDAATNGNIITSITIANGTSSSQFWYYDEIVASPTITASDNSSSPDGSTGIVDATDQITITAAATAQFALNHPGTITAGTRASYAVTRKDEFGNLTTSGTSTVYLYTNSTSTSHLFYNAAMNGNTITFIVISSSQSSADFWYFDNEAGIWTITASDNATIPDGNTGIIDAEDQLTVSAVPIVATRFVITVQPSATAGDTVEVTIKAEDANGNVDTTYNNGVTLLTSGSATLGGLVNIVNGVGTVNITDTVAESVSLSLSDTENTNLDTSSTAQVVFSSGAIAQLLLNNPGNITAGNRAAYTVTRKDEFGNLVTSGNTTIYIYSDSTSGLFDFFDAATDGNQITSVSIMNGNSSANFWYYDGGAGTWNITVSDNAVAPDGNTGIIDSVDQIVVSPAAVAQLLLNNPGDMTAGTRLGYTVTRKDVFGNEVVSDNTTIYFYSTSNGLSTAFFDAASGGNAISNLIITNGSSSANFWYFEESSGNWTVTASDNATSPDGNSGINDASDSVTVSAAPIVATKIVIFQAPDGTVGDSISVVIRAQDDNDNVDTTFNGSVSLSLSGSATGGGTVQIQNGIGTINITDAVAEVVLLTLSDTGNIGLDVSSTRSVTFSSAPSQVVQAAGGGTVTLPAILPVLPTKATVVFSGKIFPGAKLTMLAVGDGNIPVSQQTVASSQGDFTIRFSGLVPGTKQYMLVATDLDGRITQSDIYTITAGPGLTEKNILLPSTVGFAKRAIIKGGFLGLVGYGIPGNTVEVELDGIIISNRATISADGSWNIVFNTSKYDLGEHQLRVRQTGTGGISSNFSSLNSFIVTNTIVPEGDLNGDGIISASDLSIFISKWLSPDTKVRLQLDFNHDGKMNIQDLSIFVQSLKKL